MMTNTVRPTDDREPAPRTEPEDRPEDVDPVESVDRAEHVDRLEPVRWSARPGPLLVLALVVVAVFAGSAVGISVLQPRVYGAEADILLTPRPELSDTAVDRAMVTQVMVVQSPTVLAPVAARTDVPLARLRDMVTVEMVGRSNIMRITAADRGRARAVTVAGAIASEYLASVGGPGTAPTGPDTAPTGPGTAPIRATLLTAARQLDTPLRPRPLRDLAMGALLGLLVAGAVVVALSRPWRLVRPLPYWT
jgi:capsular polysaccharide biosynthesis protein